MFTCESQLSSKDVLDPDEFIKYVIYLWIQTLINSFVFYVLGTRLMLLQCSSFLDCHRRLQSN